MKIGQNINQTLNHKFTFTPALKQLLSITTLAIIAGIVAYTVFASLSPQESSRLKEPAATSGEALAAQSSNEVVAGAALPQAPESAAATLVQSNKALVQQVYNEVLNERDLAVTSALFAEGFQYYDTNTPEGVNGLTLTYRAIFFNQHYTIEDVITEGDQVVVRWTVESTYERSLEDEPPTGERIKWPGITVWQIADGKIVKAWTVESQAPQVRLEAIDR